METDFTAVRPGAWRDLRADFIDFAGVPPLRRKECTSEALAALQLSTLAVVLKASCRHGEDLGGQRFSREWDWGRPVKIRWVLSKADDGRRLVPALPYGEEGEASLQDLFRWALFVTLNQTGLSRLRRCLGPCQGGNPCLFWAEHGNQWYCSPQCANRARLRRHRYPEPSGIQRYPKEKPERKTAPSSKRVAVWVAKG